jgi:ELWxxDGT repeat protein
MDVTARQRRARASCLRSKFSAAKALRRRARTGAARPAVRAAAVAAVGLAGSSLAGGVSPAVAAAHTTVSAGVQSSGALANLSMCDPHTPASQPYDVVSVGGTLFFTADDGVHGRELWKSDGTAGGTSLVKDIDAGSGDSYGGGPRSLTAVGGTLFFTADDGVHGTELWKSDGTKAGTVMVRDIFPGKSGGYDRNGPSSLTAVGGTLFFTADDDVHGRELWTSDGTKAGTVMVKNIYPGQGGYYDGVVSSLTDVGGTLFFAADDGTTGQELWTSDGTKAGTVLVKDIRPGAYDSTPRSLTGAGGTLFFTARDGVHGRELWKSDGSEDGTVLVKDILPGVGHSYHAPSYLTNVQGTLFFSADDGTTGQELWKSDGSEDGTVLVKDIQPDDAGSYYDGPSDLAAVGSTLFFTADDDLHGEELWSSDGTEDGTAMVKDIQPGEYSSSASGLTGSGGTVFFTARDGVHGPELWKSDGTEDGTVLVKDIHPGAGGSYYDDPSAVTAVGTTVFLGADDGVHGTELWKSDGTDDGTVLVKDINAGGAFRVAARGKADTAKGTLTVKVAVAGGGTLVVRPVAGSELKKAVRVVTSADTTSITLKPTRAGKRYLKRHGTLKVRARFTFTPCGGAGSSVTHRFTLKMR